MNQAKLPRHGKEISTMSAAMQWKADANGHKPGIEEESLWRLVLGFFRELWEWIWALLFGKPLDVALEGADLGVYLTMIAAKVGGLQAFEEWKRSTDGEDDSGAGRKE